MIETRTVVDRTCPEELKLDAAPRPEPEAGARIEGNENGMAWLREIAAWGALGWARLADARKDCE